VDKENEFFWQMTPCLWMDGSWLCEERRCLYLEKSKGRPGPLTLAIESTTFLQQGVNHLKTQCHNPEYIYPSKNTLIWYNPTRRRTQQIIYTVSRIQMSHAISFTWNFLYPEGKELVIGLIRLAVIGLLLWWLQFRAPDNCLDIRCSFTRVAFEAVERRV
jgi:hypothetical protein